MYQGRKCTGLRCTITELKAGTPCWCLSKWPQHGGHEVTYLLPFLAPKVISYPPWIKAHSDHSAIIAAVKYRNNLLSFLASQVISYHRG